MASSIIHAVVAKELNKKLKRNEEKLLIGTIAPDISKIVGESKLYTHFLDDINSSVPNLTRFLNRYISKLSDDFVLGYYIHLYTDYLWFKYFIPEIYDEDKFLITKMDGTKVNCHGNMASIYIYNDYTNLNAELIKRYDLNLEFLNGKMPYFEPIIREINMNKLYLIINRTSEIVEKSKLNKEYVFDMENIEKFIDLSIKIIEADLRDMNLIKL